MTTDTPAPAIVDTGFFYALYDEDDENHPTAKSVNEGIRTNDVPLQPLYTTRYVLAELGTLILYRKGHADATRALEEILDSQSMNLIEVGPPIFTRTVQQFGKYDDQEISFIDHLTAVAAGEHDIDRVLAFDSDFATLGMTRVNRSPE